MKISKYKKSIRIFLIYAVIIAIVGIVFSFLIVGELTPFVPSDKVGIELIILLLVLYPLAAIIGAVVGTYLLSPVFLFVHKKTVGRNCDYGIEERPEEEEFNKSFRAFFASLMAINFSLMIALNFDLAGVFQIPESGGAPIVFIVLLIFTCFVSMLIFAPVWALLDSGIVYSNKEKLKDSDQPIEVRSAGSFYTYLLKGYAGIGVITTFYQFFASLIFYQLRTDREGTSGDIISTSMVLIPFPIFLTIASIPAVIMLDMVRKWRISYTRKWGRLFGIKDVFVIDLEILKASSTD